MSDDGEETVWVVPLSYRSGGDVGVYHLERDCVQLKKIDDERIFAKPKEVAEKKRRACRTCTGDVNRPTGDEYGRSPADVLREAGFEVEEGNHTDDPTVLPDGGVDRVTTKEAVHAVGYPYETLSTVIEASEDRYMEKVREHGPGKNWLDDDAHYHLWRAIVNLTEGVDTEGREIDLESAGDALNHLLFALEIEEERVATDGGIVEGVLEQADGPSGPRLGPHRVPSIECGRCGHEHHIDAATGEYQGRCVECFAFLPRPTEAEKRKFYDFMGWNARWIEAETEAGS